mmetsp:Transcript_27532/g.32567  ORF Transcript_27532/g.32567 Transcript_27532/m.32567 type:complete len:233 (-) Transcript_27532:450-1148(-)
MPIKNLRRTRNRRTKPMTLHRNRRFHPIPHQLKIPIRRHKRHNLIHLIPRIPHTRMKRTIINHTRILKREQQVGHTTEMRLDLDGTGHVEGYDVADGIEYGVDFFDDVDVYFVGVVLDSGCAPWHVGDGASGECVGDYCVGSSGDYGLNLAHNTRWSNHRRQRIRFRSQRPSVIQHLLQQLIHRTKIFLNRTLIGWIPKVIDEHIGDSMEAFQNEERRDLTWTSGKIRQTIS